MFLYCDEQIPKETKPKLSLAAPAMKITPEIDNASIVLLGRFNPAIFQPWWFAKNGIIGEQEAFEAEIEIIHPELCKFQTEYFFVQAERNRFMVRSNSGPLELIKDFALKTFTDFLTYTPIGILGINRSVHFDAGSNEARIALGKKLAPWEPWGEWARSFEGEDTEEQGGMLNLTMRQNRSKKEGLKGYVRAKIQPSSELSGNSGVFMDINNHYDVVGLEEAVGCSKVMYVLEHQWNKAMGHAEFIINQIMKEIEVLK